MCLNGSVIIVDNKFKGLEGILKYRSCSVITTAELAESVKNGICFRKSLNVSIDIKS
jgi:hypothetical protein